MMIVEPTTDVMERNVKQKIDPMIDDCPALAERVPAKGAKEGGNNLKNKEFPGGMLIFSGANSTASLRSTSIRHMMLDEIDEYEDDLNNQGAVLDLAEARTFAYGEKAKIYIPSTPTVEGMSKIAQLFERSDKRYFMMPCPCCGVRIRFEFEQLKWDGKDSETVRYECQECGEEFHEYKKTEMLDAGQWIATDPKGEFAGYHINSLYSPVGWLSWKKIVRLWLAAQGNPKKLKTFVNTILAQTWKERGDAPEWKRLYERREPYKMAVVPMKGLVLTAGVDVQKDRIEVEVVAYGRNIESWSVDYRVFEGDTSSIDDPCWKKLAAMLNEDFLHECGTYLRLDRMGIDSGYNTNTVYAFVRKYGQERRVIATKGKDTSPVMIGIPQAKEARTDGKRLKRGVKVYEIGTNLSKSELYGFLRLERPTDPVEPLPSGWCHFPEYQEEYFKMLTAEQVVEKVVKGYTRREWEKTRERNEALDCRVIARAVSYQIGIDRWKEDKWQERADEIGIDDEAKEVAEKKSEEPIKQAQAQEKKRESENNQDVVFRKSSFW
jgi:phage terminase large subunit GpA-like protein